MNIEELCEKINLQQEIKMRVISFATDFDFNKVNKQLKDFLVYENMDVARKELQNILGKDEDNIKMLSCMLQASADVYDIYKIKGIDDIIYIETMKCYMRFINETYKMTGRLYFDRDWWTVRQAGCHIYRIGELEYELKPTNTGIVINIHIPSDAKFQPKLVDESLEKARVFFAQYYSSLKIIEYGCQSWLLDNQLKGMLGADSNIISFQRRFEILEAGKKNTEFIGWLYQTKSTDYRNLPENSSLQRNMKKFLIAGGNISSPYGKLVAY